MAAALSGWTDRPALWPSRFRAQVFGLALKPGKRVAVTVEHEPPATGTAAGSPLPGVATGVRHRLSWTDFDALARGTGRAGMVRRLREAERSRRLLLLRVLLDEVAAYGDPGEMADGVLPPVEDAWDLLARVQQRAPA